MAIKKYLIEATIGANATDQKLWEMTCPTTVNRRVIETRSYLTGAGVLRLERETEQVTINEKTISDHYKRPDILDIAWEAGVTLYLYGTDRSGASNDIKYEIIFEEVPIV